VSDAPDPSTPPAPDGGQDQGTPRAPRQVTVHRAPRYGVFTATGAILGVVAAVILTFAGSPTTYGYAALLGYLAVMLGAFGALLGALVAVLVGIRVSRRR
jgi:membrane associated rhomboid family serine protease